MEDDVQSSLVKRGSEDLLITRDDEKQVGAEIFSRIRTQVQVYNVTWGHGEDCERKECSGLLYLIPAIPVMGN